MATRRAQRQERPMTEESARLSQIRTAREDLNKAEKNLALVEDFQGDLPFEIPDHEFADFEEVRDGVRAALSWDVGQEIHDELKDAGVELDRKVLTEMCASIEDRYAKIVDEALSQLLEGTDAAIQSLKKSIAHNATEYLYERTQVQASEARTKLERLERAFVNKFRRKTAA